MPLILNIDTATDKAIVCLSDNKEILAVEESYDQKNHAAFVQPAIEKIFYSTNLKLENIDAVAVTAGPGSYTGLRVGLASAKGLCYVLGKPLILINTLELMAYSAIREIKNSRQNSTNFLFCPMIDARRMEVFTAMYDARLEVFLQPLAMIINENSFEKELSTHKIIFNGSGRLKLESLICHENAIFLANQHDALDFLVLSFNAFTAKHFASLAYSEPFYLKDFFNSTKK